jgi:hypothetical protein
MLNELLGDNTKKLLLTKENANAENESLSGLTELTCSLLWAIFGSGKSGFASGITLAKGLVTLDPWRGAVVQVLFNGYKMDHFNSKTKAHTISIRCRTATTEAIIVSIAVCIAHGEVIKMLLDIVSHETAGYEDKCAAEQHQNASRTTQLLLGTGRLAQLWACHTHQEHCNGDKTKQNGKTAKESRNDWINLIDDAIK